MLEPKRDKEVGVGVTGLDPFDRWMTEMVVVGVRYHDDVDDGDVFDLAGNLGVPFGSKPGERTATGFEHRVEEDAETAGEFNEVASVAEPGSP